MEVTDYFRRNVLENPERPGITREMRERAVETAEHSERQADGRFRFWARPEGKTTYLSVIVTGDRRSPHNAFFDSDFAPRKRSET